MDAAGNSKGIGKMEIISTSGTLTTAAVTSSLTASISQALSLGITLALVLGFGFTVFWFLKKFVFFNRAAAAREAQSDNDMAVRDEVRNQKQLQRFNNHMQHGGKVSNFRG